MSAPNLWADPASNQRPDGLLNAIPVVQCRNEERFIADVLRPLYNVFGYALVGDTGSNDGTLPILRDLAADGRIGLYEYGLLDMAGVGQTRARLGREARALGARFIFLVDGDEVYNEAALLHVAREPMPLDKTLGFTCGGSVDEQDGQMYELEERLLMNGRTALIRTDDTWTGAYPFEGPSDFNRPASYYYFSLPKGQRYHYLHVHRCVRSSRDAEVPYRVEKQKQFSMQERGTVGLGPAVDYTRWIGEANG